MKKSVQFNFIFAILLSVFAGCTKDPGNYGERESRDPGYTQEEFVPGVLRVKMKAEAGELDTGKFTRSGGSGVAAFDATATRAGATAIRRIFSEGGRFRERRRKAELHLWYDVNFSGTMTLEEAMAEFAGTDGIEVVEPVYRMVSAGSVTGYSGGYTRYASTSFDDPLLESQWMYHNDGLKTGSVAGADINLFTAWTATTGHPDVIVAIMDSGFDYLHPDLAANVWYNEQGTCGYNFNRHTYEIIPGDHGTHVAGTVAAVNNNGIGVCGIAGGDGSYASGVRIMSCVVLDSEGNADFGEAMAYAADNGAVISQNSWSYPLARSLAASTKAAMDYFIENAGFDENGNQTGPMAGGLIVFAAGNDGLSRPTYPGAYEKALAVGSIGSGFILAADSNHGDWVDLLAPGVNVYSTLANEQYGPASGTSMAAPHVSGIAALAVAKYGTQGPGFTSKMLRDLLMASGRKEEAESYNPAYAGMMGNGLVDAEYVIYGTTAPQPAADFTATGRHYHIGLEWKVPECYGGLPATVFEVFMSEEPFPSGAVYADIPANAVKYEVENPDGEIGSVMTMDLGEDSGVEQQKRYYFAVVSKSKYGIYSPLALASAKTAGNTAPMLDKSLPDLYISRIGEAGKVTIDLDQYFSDVDIPGDELSYFVNVSAGGVVDCVVTGNTLSIVPQAVGIVELTIIVWDREGETVGDSFKVMVIGTGASLDLYPNPFSNVLNVKVPGANGRFSVIMYNQAGQKVLDSYVTMGIIPAGAVDTEGLSPGNYTFVLDYYGRKLEKNVVKR